MLRSWAVAGTFLLGISAASGQEPTECDRLASSPFDLEAVSAGVGFNDIDTAKAIPACKAALRANPTNLRLQFLLARSTEAGGDEAEAFRLFLAAAEGGYPAAMNGVGRMFRRGGGTALDFDKAIYWFGRSALAGDVAAMINLGELYEDGAEGFRIDHATAYVWYRMAADAGYRQGQSEVGYFYAVGRGVELDLEEARAWFEKAAAQDDAVALKNLGFMYETGAGVAIDEAKAAGYFVRAIALGNSDALDSFVTYAPDITAEMWTAIETAIGVRADGVPDEATIRALAAHGGFDADDAVRRFRIALAPPVQPGGSRKN